MPGAISSFLGHGNYAIPFIIMLIGLYGVSTARNLIHKLFGLMIFQSAIILFYVSMAFVKGGRPPLLKSYTVEYVYHSPLPHVLMLTAIVVGLATLSVGLAIAVRIKREYGTLDCTHLEKEIAAKPSVVSGSPEERI